MPNIAEDVIERALIMASRYYGEAIFVAKYTGASNTEEDGAYIDVKFDDLYDNVQNSQPFTTSQERIFELIRDIDSSRARGDTEVAEYLEELLRYETEIIAPNIQRLDAQFVARQTQIQIERTQVQEQNNDDAAEKFFVPVDGEQLHEEWNTTLLDIEMENVDVGDPYYATVMEVEIGDFDVISVETIDDSQFDAQLERALSKYLESSDSLDDGLSSRQRENFSRG